MGIRALFLSLLVVYCVSPAWAQRPDSVPDRSAWTLRECVEYALANNLDVRRSELSLQLSNLDKRQATMAMLPSANAFASYGFNWGRGIDPVTNQFVSSQRNGYTQIGASGDMDLFNGLRLQHTLKQASTDLEASEQDLDKTRNDVTLNVISLFVNVVFNRELLENARWQLSSSEQQRDRIRRLVAAGSLPKSEELNLDAQVATNEVNVINQENALNLSLLQLQQALQIPASYEFDVEIPEITAEDLILEQTRDEIFRIAMGTMPEIRSSKLRIESTGYGIKAARGALYPRLNVSGSINSNYSSSSATRFVPDGTFTQQPTRYFVEGTNAPIYGLEPHGTYQDIYGFNDQLKDNLYKSVSLRLSIPIFNGLTARTGLQRAMISNEQARINAREVENILRQNVETSYNNAIAASKSYSASLRQVDAREEAFRMVGQRYDVGAANFVEYQVAENDLFQARSDLSRAKYEFIFRKKVLDFYLGNSLGF